MDSLKKFLQHPKNEGILNSEVKPIPFSTNKFKQSTGAFNQTGFSPFNSKSSRSNLISNQHLNDYIKGGRDSDQKLT